MATDVALQAMDFSPDPQAKDLSALPDGALVVDDWRNAYIARGYGWTFSVGTFSAAISGGGSGSTLLNTDPEWVIEVPQGQTCVPLRMAVDLQLPLMAADDDECEAVIIVDRTQVGGSVAADGTVEAPLNMRTDKIGGCPCNCLSALVNAANTTPTRSLELARVTVVADEAGTPETALWTEASLLYEPETPPFIVGPATVACYWGGTVQTDGFAQVFFLSIPSAQVTNLT